MVVSVKGAYNNYAVQCVYAWANSAPSVLHFSDFIVDVNCLVDESEVKEKPRLADLSLTSSSSVMAAAANGEQCQRQDSLQGNGGIMDIMTPTDEEAGREYSAVCWHNYQYCYRKYSHDIVLVQ